MSASDVTRIREKLNLRQNEFARLIGTTPNTVHRWEKGIHPVSAPYARLIAMAESGELQQAS